MQLSLSRRRVNFHRETPNLQEEKRIHRMAQQYDASAAINFRTMDLVFEKEYQVVWGRLKYSGRPCMTTDVLADLTEAQQQVADIARLGFKRGDERRLKYQVLCSDVPGVFNLGGDLAHFIQLIQQRDRLGLYDYASACVDIVYRTTTGYDLPFTTIALVQGETLGGGFEAALSSNLLIAEKSAKFGFPETVFGLFPGMGAFNLLARRIAPSLAKRIIASGRVYGAEELYEMGVVDQLVSDGRGEQAVYDYIHAQRNRSAGSQGFDKIVEQFNPVTLKELQDSIGIWVDTALHLSSKNIRMMEYLLNAQERRWGSHSPSNVRSLAV